MTMSLNEYQSRAGKTAIYPGRNALFHNGKLDGLIYTTLGLTGEAGEFAEKVKKILRDQAGLMDAHFEQKALLVKELGDVLWYVSQCAFELGMTLNAVAMINLEKLESRMDTNHLHGSGDER